MSPKSPQHQWQEAAQPGAAHAMYPSTTQHPDELTRQFASLGYDDGAAAASFDPNTLTQLYPQHQQQPSYYDYYGATPGYYPFSVETMHGMPSYPGRPPVPRSNGPSPIYAGSPTYYTQQRPHPPPSAYWGSPPLSPVMSQHVPLPHRSPRHGSFSGHAGQLIPLVDDFGNPIPTQQPLLQQAPPSAWTSPSAPSYPVFTPYSTHQPTFETPPPPFASHSTSPSRSFHGRNPSWSGPSAPVPAKAPERKAYHPQPPARRSDWVMWVGNVPPNTSHEELWRYFNTTVPPGDAEWKGPSSIFLISRSSCAFVNLSSQDDLDRAVAFFNGKPLRPWDMRCPRMVCRVRRKDDDLRSGVGAQRGTGMHREWVKAQPQQQSSAPASRSDGPSTLEPVTPSVDGSVPPSPAILEHPPEGEGRRRESIVNVKAAAAAEDALSPAGSGEAEPRKHASSASFASTNSSFLTRHFPKRIFILKSLTTAELEDSVKNGSWRTQRHNEPILDQAFRTSQEVFLIFGANRSGEFFGFAKMVEPIDKEKAKTYKGKEHSGSGSSGRKAPSPIQEERQDDPDRTRAASDPPVRPDYFLSPSQSKVTSSSPGELTPNEEARLEHMADGDSPAKAAHQRHTDPEEVIRRRAREAGAARAQTLNPKDVQPNYFPPVPIVKPSNEHEAERQEELGGSSRAGIADEDGVKRKDTALSSGEKERKQEEYGKEHDGLPDGGEKENEFAPDGWGSTFRIEWVKVGGLPFGKTRHLRNPWNADREVKVSRDGTEVEPGVGAQLMAEWDKLEAAVGY